MPFTLAHLSDIHLSPLPRARGIELLGKRITGYINWRRNRHLIHDRVALDALTADLQNQEPAHIAVTGDIANIALPEEFTAGRAWLESLGTPNNVTAIPGNHDIYVRSGTARAVQEWGSFMRGDDGAGFPFVRKRGPVALIGLNSGVATAPFRATGRLGQAQLAALPAILDRLKEEGFFRVVLIHHPPLTDQSRWKHLTDASAFQAMIRRVGCEIVLHGHNHRSEVARIMGPAGAIPVLGVSSASAARESKYGRARWHLIHIERDGEGCRLQVQIRALNADNSGCEPDGDLVFHSGGRLAMVA